VVKGHSSGVFFFDAKRSSPALKAGRPYSIWPQLGAIRPAISSMKPFFSRGCRRLLYLSPLIYPQSGASIETSLPSKCRISSKHSPTRVRRIIHSARCLSPRGGSERSATAWAGQPRNDHCLLWSDPNSYLTPIIVINKSTKTPRLDAGQHWVVVPFARFGPSDRSNL
jgi:hypothetical protein